VYVALAAPLVTVPLVTAAPTSVPPLNTVKVTVPTFTAPDPLVTVADKETVCELEL
jgi:hypothetical protein